MAQLYDTFSWQSAQVPGDDGYVDEISDLLIAIASLDAEAVGRARAAVGVRRRPMQAVSGVLPRVVKTNGLLTSSPSPAKVLAVFDRDRHRCRYCGTRVFPPDVLLWGHRVGKRLGNALPRDRNWRPQQTDPVFYWQFATLEHLVPVSRGGDARSEANLRTACWPCQTRKSTYLLEELGWRELDSPQDDWKGLRDLVPILRAHVHTVPADRAPTSVTTSTRPKSMTDNSRWVRISFHATCDGRDGALVAAAILEGARTSDVTKRGALKTKWTQDDVYTSCNGRWRIRRPTTVDLVEAGRKAGQGTTWLLEMRCGTVADVSVDLSMKPDGES